MKIAVYFTKRATDCPAVIGRMTAAMQLQEDQRCGSFAVSGGSLGYVITGDRFSSIPLLREGRDGNVLMISGVPIDIHGSLEETLANVIAGDYRQAREILCRLDGAFAAVFWDGSKQKLLMVTDALGMQPLYIARQDGVLILATELKAFPASGLVPVEINPAAWGAFVSLGFTIGDQTQLAGVKRVEPGCVLIYDPASDTLDSAKHWDWPTPEPEMKLEDADTAGMVRIVQREIESYASHCRSGTILLSGGFDSRLILALLNRAGLEYNAMVLTHPVQGFGADGKFAVKIARILNCQKIAKVYPSSNYYSSPSYLRYLMIDEVAIPSMVLHMSTYLFEHIKPEMKAVWEGLGPGFAFAPAFPLAGGFSTYIQDRCKDRDTMNWQALFAVFSDAAGQKIYEEYKQALAGEIRKYTDDDFGVARFQMANQMRNFLALSPLTVYANCVLPFTPALSKDLWNIAARIPHRVTAHHKLYLRLLMQHFPEALAVPICSGGKLMSHKSFTPGLWLRRKLNPLSSWSRYYWRRLPRIPVLGPAFSRMGLIPPLETERNEILDTVIKLIPADHPDINADAVRALQKAEPPYSWQERLGRRMLFYWQAWRLVMEGRMTTRNTQSFLEQNDMK